MPAHVCVFVHKHTDVSKKTTNLIMIYCVTQQSLSKPVCMCIYLFISKAVLIIMDAHSTLACVSLPSQFQISTI